MGVADSEAVGGALGMANSFLDIPWLWTKVSFFF